MQPFTYLDENKLILLVSNDTSIYALTSDGDSWTTTNSGQPLGTTLPTAEDISYYLDSYGQTALLVSDHRSGQVSQSMQSNASSGANIFSFLLKPREGNPKTVTEMIFRMENLVGVESSDLSNVQVFRDANGDGLIGSGESTALGDVGSVSTIGSTGTITFSTEFEISDFTYLVLTVDIANLGDADEVTVTLSKDDFTLQGDTVITGEVTDARIIQGGSGLKEAGDVRLLYATAEAPSDTLRTRIYDHSEVKLSSEELTQSTNTVVWWMEHAIHPSGGQELVMSLSSTGPTTEVIRWDGSEWKDD